MSPFSVLNPAVTAAYHAVSGIAAALAPVAGDTGAALAIVLFTLAIRLLMHPLARAQSRAAAEAQRARAALAPEVKKLRRTFRNDPVRLNRATLELYRERGVSNTAGMLPGMLQLPVLLVMYRLFASRTVGGRPNGLLGHSVAGVPLGSHLRDAFAGGHVLLGHLAVFALLIVLAAAVARWSSTLAAAAADRAAALGEPAPLGALARWLPYGSLLTAAFVPLATGLYLATTTLWAVAERAFLARGQA
ncbi:MAG TPA: membrane protein insertase YidC [Actinocrinis sp.]|nr:membrane protein insertase YidC [Actinocrinis sp.]